MNWATIDVVLKHLGDYGAMYLIVAIFLTAVVVGLRLFYKYTDRILNSKFPAEEPKRKEEPGDESGAGYAPTPAPHNPTPLHSRMVTPPHMTTVLTPQQTSWADVENHPFFSVAQVLTNWDVAMLKFSDAGRTAVFRDLLTTYLYVWDESVRLMVKRLPSAQLSSAQQFAAAHQHSVLQAVELSKQEWAEDGIPPVVIEKFLDWVAFRTRNLLDDIQLIACSRHTLSAPDRSFEVLTLFRSSLRFTIYEAETVLALINGDLTGVVYKDHVIGPEPSANTTILRNVYDRRKSGPHTTQDADDASTNTLAVDLSDGDIRRRVAARKTTQKYTTKNRIDKPDK